MRCPPASHVETRVVSLCQGTQLSPARLWLGIVLLYCVFCIVEFTCQGSSGNLQPDGVSRSRMVYEGAPAIAPSASLTVGVRSHE